MTIAKALEEGYTLCGRPQQEWQHLLKIDEMTEPDFEEGKWVLADKEPMTVSTSNEEIQELLADHMEAKWCDQCADDTEEVYKTVKELNFTQTAKLINDSLVNQKAYNLTQIQLVP